MANKTPKFTIRKVPQTVAEWQDIVRYLNKLIEGAELTAAIQSHDEAADAHPSAFAAHKAEADPHPVYLTQAEGDARYTAGAASGYSEPIVDNFDLIFSNDGDIVMCIVKEGIAYGSFG